MNDIDQNVEPTPLEENPGPPTKMLEGRVAQVLNERELVINIGVERGVRPGMRFKVLAKERLKIKDPETGQFLGELEQDKVRVEVTRVQDRMAVCRTYVTWTEGGELWLGSALIQHMMRPARTIHETLSAEKEAFPAPLSQEESYVKIGDRVRQLLPAEDTD